MLTLVVVEIQQGTGRPEAAGEVVGAVEASAHQALSQLIHKLASILTSKEKSNAREAEAVKPPADQKKERPDSVQVPPTSRRRSLVT